jgi:hypothetical protein
MWKNAVDVQLILQEVEPKISYNEENIKHYLDEAMNEIEIIRGLNRVYRRPYNAWLS